MAKVDKKYKIVNINTASPYPPYAKVLIIYTGGTLGMVRDKDGSLVAFKFNKIIEEMPSLRTLGLKLTVISFPNPVDSSNINHESWNDIGYIIKENHLQYDGFVILHGTDTMAYTASALSYMLEGLKKPVIFTGAQLPIGARRTDARANLITALEIASAKDEESGEPLVPEIAIYFDYQLFRGNRAQKIRSSQFAAFDSLNYPILAKAGVNIYYNYSAIGNGIDDKPFTFRYGFDPNVTFLKIFPSLGEQIVKNVLSTPGLHGVVMATYGSGNDPTNDSFLGILKDAIKNNIIIFNVSQCSGGRVVHGRYETSKKLEDIGVVSGSDITSEAAVTKLMFLLGNFKDNNEIKHRLEQPLNGEMS